MPNPECFSLHTVKCGFGGQETKVPFWVPLFEITSLQTGVYSIPLPAPFFHSARLRGLPICTFFFRCLILTQKIAGFNSFARWLRKERLTVSAKCLCQSPKQPVSINIKSSIDLLTCKGKRMGWWNLILDEKGKHTASFLLSDAGPTVVLRGDYIYEWEGNVNQNSQHNTLSSLLLSCEGVVLKVTRQKSLVYLFGGQSTPLLFSTQCPVFSNEIDFREVRGTTNL